MSKHRQVVSVPVQCFACKCAPFALTLRRQLLDPLVDFGIYLRYSHMHASSYRDGFAAGYVDAGGELPEDWFRLARVHDLVNLAYFLEFRGRDPAIPRDIVPLIEMTLADFAR